MNEQNKASGPLLEGLRVLDISTMIAAPISASLLADYGADVVKIEKPELGDFVRKFGAQKEGEGLYWKTLSRNKRTIGLDLHVEEAKELIREMVRKFDILIENFRPGTLEKWGLSPKSLMEINPSLIVLRVTAYGQDGPYRNRPGFGTLAEAMAGLASVSGYEGQDPLLPAYPLADILSGHLGTAAILAAVYKRERTGVGECIDLAIYESALKLIDLNIVEYDQNGTEHARLGNRMSASAPRGAYKCHDGQWIALSGSSQPVAERILRAVGGEQLVSDPRFLTNADRVENVEKLDETISAWCHLRDRDRAIEELSQTGCAVGPLESVGSMFENPQVRFRQSILKVPAETGSEVAMTNVFPKFKNSQLGIRNVGASLVGADTREFLTSDLNLTNQQIQKLNDLGAIRIGGEKQPVDEYVRKRSM